MFHRLDFLLCGITIVLTCFGLAMIASVSVFDSYQITGTNSFYLIRSSAHVLIGLCAMGFCTIVPYRAWEKLAMPLFFITLILLIVVFLPGIGVGGNDAYTAKSWIRIGGFSMQPSEILKLTMIFYMSVWLQKREQLVGTWQEGFIPFSILLSVSTVLVAIQPDLGSFLVLSAIAITMFFVAGGNIVHVMLGGSVASVLGLPIILNKSYVQTRFQGFFQIIFSNHSISENPVCNTKAGYQVCQALIAIGSGGFFGVGYGKSIQKFGYLPEAQSDTIFAAMSEELGFMRLMIIMTLYTLLVWRGYRIASDAPDRFGFLVATGITTWIAFQTLLNMGVNLALFPLTGITLPFISYGGSSLLMLLSAVGILLNISMYSSGAAGVQRRKHKGLKLGWLGT